MFADGILNTKKWSTTLELTAATADHIDNFRNAERRHSYLGKHQPDRVEEALGRHPAVPQLS